MTAPAARAGAEPKNPRPAPAGSRLRRVFRFVALELRDYPATAFFSAAWVAVFVAMVWVHLGQDPSPSWMRLLVLGIGDGHRFGDLTLEELYRGQVWRLITCNFVHYSVIHIVLNLLAFYLLGTLVESWYGSGQFVLFYGLAGGGGNLLSAVARHALGWSPLTHAGGGSVVVMGLVGLCAMVGWRSRTSRGSDLGWQMFKALCLTMLLGIAFPRYIDNMGHAGGAVVGFAVGLFHRGLLKRRGRPSAWAAGLAAGLVIAGSGMAQYRYDRAETPLRREVARLRELEQTRHDLESRVIAYRALRNALLLIGSPANAASVGPLLDRAAPVLDRGASKGAFLRLRELAGEAAVRELSAEERAEFRGRALPLASSLQGELRQGYREYRARRSSRLPLRLQREVLTGPLVRRAPAR